MSALPLPSLPSWCRTAQYFRRPRISPSARKYTVFQCFFLHIGENHKLLIRKALRRMESLFCKHLAEFHGKRIGAASCSEVEIMFQQAVELQSEQPAFGEDSAVLLHVGFETLFQCIRRDHNSLAKQRPAFRSAEIENICESGEILKRNIILFRSQTVAKPCPVHEQIHIILRQTS